MSNLSATVAPAELGKSFSSVKTLADTLHGMKAAGMPPHPRAA